MRGLITINMAKPMHPATTPCPCGKSVKKKQLLYSECCGRYIEEYEQTPAPNAESLMRSRYSAFVLQRAEYLLNTWDPNYRPPELILEAKLKWLGLSIRASSTTGPDEAQVEFVARSRLNGRGIRLHERSRFIRRDGRWFYVDGTMLD